jgi:hypothetical protein
MNTDEQLAKMLREWKGVEPSPAFESRVWRRIRQGGVEPAPAWGWPFPLPARAMAAAALVGVVMGGVALRLAAGDGSRSRPPELALFRPGTVSGSYTHLLTGGP